MFDLSKCHLIFSVVSMEFLRGERRLNGTCFQVDLDFHDSMNLIKKSQIDLCPKYSNFHWKLNFLLIFILSIFSDRFPSSLNGVTVQPLKVGQLCLIMLFLATHPSLRYCRDSLSQNSQHFKKHSSRTYQTHLNLKTKSIIRNCKPKVFFETSNICVALPTCKLHTQNKNALFSPHIDQKSNKER